MLLAIDVGNTNTVFGLCPIPQDGHMSADRLRREDMETWHVSTRADRMPDEWFALLSPLLQASGHSLEDISAVVIGSVVPAVTGWLSQMCHERMNQRPLIVGPHLDLGIELLTDFPPETGADRIANAVAAAAHYHLPAIVIDFGTATSFDVVNEQGNFIGGAIAPGLEVSLEALTRRAARLHSIELSIPAHAIGTNTRDAILAGTVLGYASLVEGVLERIRQELPDDPTVVVTGGLAPVIASSLRFRHAHDPLLTIEGLRLIFLRSRYGTTSPASSGESAATLG